MTPRDVDELHPSERKAMIVFANAEIRRHNQAARKR
jgi:hypothetical protein